MSEPLRIGFVAGESSGDQLGAALIGALRAREPRLQCYGVAGPKMRAAGCEAWADADELAVMGLIEPLKHLPRLSALRAMLRRRFAAERTSIFVGIDAPAFNLGLAAHLKQVGLKTVQYVSPQVWAWRPGRVHKIARACDLVLCLLPFETEFYARQAVPAIFVGHPLADQIPLEPDRAGARRALGLAADATVVAVLPGSRLGEVKRLGKDFVGAIAWLRERRPGLEVIAPMASKRVRALFERQAAARGLSGLRLLDGRSHEVLAAADAVLVASGTATLETLLSKRPMVAAYRFNPLTAFLVRGLGLVKVPYFSQPNLLLGRSVVPEFLQEQVSAAALGAALARELDDPQRAAELKRLFTEVHLQLRRGAAERAATAVLELAGRPPR